MSEKIRNIAIIAHANHGKTMIRKVVLEGISKRSREISKDKKQTKTNFVTSFYYNHKGKTQ